MNGEAQAVVIIGKDDWPLPIPLVKARQGWHFDAQQGGQEIRNRRVGRNELNAIQVCLALVDAEREYATRDYDQDGLLEYAPRFVSSRGKHDGLYWPNEGEETQSPIGPLLTAAANESGGGAKQRVPYHGYYYRILTKQGKNAPGGAYGYIVNGSIHAHMTLANPEKAFGGHLERGTSVFTFAIVTLGVFDNSVDLSRVDDKTYR